ncbi:hypothetical protein INT47_003004, partial [Mucor saturninus]
MFSISGKIIFEDGQGNLYNENGEEAMDWEEDVDPYNLQNLTNLTRYKEHQPIELDPNDPALEKLMGDVQTRVSSENSKLKYNTYSVDQKTLFLYYLKIKLYKAAKAAKMSEVNERTGQQWAKRLREDAEWNIYEKNTNRVNRKTSQLQEEHKQFLINYYDEFPQARTKDAVDSLTENFENFSLKETVVGEFISKECNLSIKRITRHPKARNDPVKLKARREWVEEWSKTSMDFNTNCIFIDESAFDINMRPSTARSARGTPAIVVTPSTKAISHTILGAISAMGVINIEIRVPVPPKKMKVVGSRKRKASAPKKPSFGGTNSGHYLNFIKKTLDQMDKYPEMKGFYLIMDNSPIHDKKDGDIDHIIESRGYKCVYLPPYSPELNPIEQFWAVVKGKVRRSQFGNTEDLKTRISEA